MRVCPLVPVYVWAPHRLFAYYSLTGPQKPDNGGIRPIAIGDALARLSSRCTCRALSDASHEHFTAPIYVFCCLRGPPSVRSIQLGVGVSGGADVTLSSTPFVSFSNVTPTGRVLVMTLATGLTPSLVRRLSKLSAITLSSRLTCLMSSSHTFARRPSSPVVNLFRLLISLGLSTPRKHPFVPALFALALHPVLQRVQEHEQFPEPAVFLTWMIRTCSGRRGGRGTRLVSSTPFANQSSASRRAPIRLMSTAPRLPSSSSTYCTTETIDIPPAPAPDAPEPSPWETHQATRASTACPMQVSSHRPILILNPDGPQGCLL